MSDSALFDVVRDIVGRGLTQPEVDRINAALGHVSGGGASGGGGSGGYIDPQLIADLKRDEGLVLKAYQDTVGVWTIGYGHAHVQPGTVWTQEQAEAALRQDVAKHNKELDEALPWAIRLDPVRRRVLQNMAFNLGLGSAVTGKGLLGFKNTLEFVRTGQYDRAADGMLASKWAKQVKGRADRLAQQMRTGR